MILQHEINEHLWDEEMQELYNLNEYDYYHIRNILDRKKAICDVLTLDEIVDIVRARKSKKWIQKKTLKIK